MLIQLTSFAMHDSRSSSSLPTYDYGLRRRLGRNHVQRFASCNPEPLPLTDSELMDAGMLAEHATGRVGDLPARCRRLDSLLLEIRVDELRIITIRNEADLLAVVLGRNGQPVLASKFANLRLQQMRPAETSSGTTAPVSGRKGSTSDPCHGSTPRISSYRPVLLIEAESAHSVRLRSPPRRCQPPCRETDRT